MDLHFHCRHGYRERIRWRPPPGLITISLACALLLIRADAPAKETFRGSQFGFVHSDDTIGVGSYTEADYSRDRSQSYLGTMVFANTFGSGAAEAGYRITFDVPTARTIRFRAALYRQSAALTYGSAAFAGNSAFWVINGNRDTKQIDAWLTPERCTEIAIAMAQTAIGVEATTVREAIRELALDTYKENLQDIFEGLFEQGEADSVIIDRTFEAPAGPNEIIVGVRSQASGVAWDSARAFVHARLREIAVWGIGTPESPQIEGPAVGCPNADYEFAAFHDFPRIGTGNLNYSYRFVWGDGTSTGWSGYVPCGTPVIETHRFPDRPDTVTYKVIARTKDALDPTDVAADSLFITIGSHAPAGRPLVYASSAVDCDTVKVRWTAVAGATGYRLYRDGLTEGDIIYQGPSLSFPDLPPYQPTYPQYSYRVRADNACGFTQCVYPAYGHRQMPPEAPPAVTATDYDSCAVVVSWTPVDSLLVAGTGFPVGIADSYSIWRSTGTNPLTAVQIGVSAGGTHGTTYRDTPPLADVYYRYWVKAHNACGASPLSGSYGSGRLPPTPPQPTGVSASDGSSCGVVSVTWNHVAGPWSYFVHRDGLRISEARDHSFDDGTAQPGQTYDYTVVACRDCDPAQCVASAPDQGYRATPPGTPGGVMATDGLCGQVQVSWSVVPGATSYKVYRDSALIGTVGAAPLTDTGFTSFVDHAYAVQACAGCGCGPLSATDIGSGRRVPAGAPASVSADDHVCGPITVTWSAVPHATSYELTRSSAPLTTVTGTSYTDNSVAPGSSYTYSIRARNDCGSSSQSANDPGSTRGDLTTGPVLTASDGDGCEVSLSWSAVPAAEHYSIYRQDTVSEGIDTLQTVWNITHYTDHPPLYGPRYRYLVRAHACNEAEGNWDPGHAYAPTITLRDVLDDAGGQLTVAWSTFPRCPSDQRADVARYEVQRRDVAGAEWSMLDTVGASMAESLELQVPTPDICSPDGRQRQGVYRVAAFIVDVPFYTSEITGCSFDNLTSPAPAAVTRQFRDLVHGGVVGLAAVDTVYVLGGPQRADGDFETYTGPDPEGWTGQDLSAPGSAGSFGAVRTDLASHDQDRCADDPTPALAFVDDGVVVPGTPASCITWCYGPGGHVVNPDGGRAGPDTHLDNMFVSPPLGWPAGHPGAVLRFDLYRHEQLDPVGSPGLFCRWKVRSSTDGGLTWGLWQDRGLAYYGGPDWIRFEEDVSDLLDPVRTTVQIALGVQELGWLWGMNGADATPAPYYDNVALLAYAAGGPVIAARAVDLAQDALPASGGLDLVNLASNAVPFNMARDISAAGSPNPWYGDSLVVWSAPGREGATLSMPPQMRYLLRRNPLFDSSCRASGRPNSGVVTGAMCLRDGIPVPNRWSFTLPDTGFLFPGDVLHYYFVARDKLGANIAQSRLPADTTGFSCFPDALGSPPPNCSRPRYPELFTLRALPSLASASAGDQPPILLWIDTDMADIRDVWLTALDNLGYREGADYDLYVTNGSSSGVGNGLGARSTPATLQGYQTILYDCGDERVMTLCGNSGGLDRGGDLGLLDAWLRLGGRHLLAAGNHLVSDLADRTAGQAFLGQWFGVALNADDAHPLLSSQGAVRVSPVQGNTVFDEQLAWIANDNCPRAQGLDVFTATVPTERLAAYLSPAGQPYAYAAAARRSASEFGADILLLGCSLGQTMTDISGLPEPDTLTMGARVLGPMLAAFGETPASPAPTSVIPPPAGVFTCRAYPNPFNPRVLFAYDMPAAGRLTIRVYDLRGRLVRRLVAGEVPAGRGEMVWDGTDDAGAPVASGAYCAKSTAQGVNLLGRLMLVR